MTAPMVTTLGKRDRNRQRNEVVSALRREFAALEYDEVETPLLVRLPGQEPAINAFRTQFVPELGSVPARPLWLHTSPEYAMKRLVADGWPRVFQLCKVFRNGEVTPTHNPEFTMLEFYRAQADYSVIMDDLERLFRAAAKALGVGERVTWNGREIDLSAPFERVSVRDAVLRETGLDVLRLGEASELAREAKRLGFHVPGPDASWDDVFFAVFLSAVEPRLGTPRPTFLTEYPARMASLARVSPTNPGVAERFELYAGGLELANGFSELNDPDEQRRRFEAEREERRAAGRETYPVDEKFLASLARLPEAGGVAVGLDRLVMLLTGAESIADVLLFPAESEWRD